MINKEELLVGISYARTYKILARWEAFLKVLDVPYHVSDMDLHDAAAIADKRFIYAREYCFTRRATLGEYVNLVEEVGCNVLLTGCQLVEGNEKCNTIRYVPTQIAEYYKDRDVTVIDACISTNAKVAGNQLEKIALCFTEDKELAQKAVEAWFAVKETKQSPIIHFDNEPTIFMVGSAAFHFNIAGSYMTRFLNEKLRANIVGPESASKTKNSLIYREAYKKIYHKNIINIDRVAYWERPTILGTLLNVKDEIDGVIFVRDKYCVCKIEEIDLLKQIVDKEKLPFIVIDYREENRVTTETVLETFVEMLRMRRQTMNEEATAQRRCE